jgi:hypothetical protein
MEIMKTLKGISWFVHSVIEGYKNIGILRILFKTWWNFLGTKCSVKLAEEDMY